MLDQMQKEHIVFSSSRLSVLETVLIKEIEKEKKQEPLKPVIVVVGTRELASYLEGKLLDAQSEQDQYLFNIKFLLIPDLVNYLYLSPPFSSFKQRESELLTRTALKMAFRQEMENNLFIQRGWQEKKANAILSTRRDLLDGMVELDAFRELLEKEPELSSSRERLNSLLDLMNSVNDKLKDFETEHERFMKAIHRAKNFSVCFGTDKIFIYGFYDLTRLQMALFEEIFKYVHTMAFILTRKGKRIFKYTERIYNWYKGLGFKEKIEDQDEEPENILEYLRKKWREEKSSVEKPSLMKSEALKVIIAPTEVEEVREIARQILYLVRKNKYKFSDIAILLRQYEVYKPLIEEIFDYARIPVEFYPEGNFSQSLSSKSLLKLLSLSKKRFSRVDVMEFFRLSEESKKFKDIPKEEFYFFDIVSREAKISADSEKWSVKLKMYEDFIKRKISSIEEKDYEEPEILERKLKEYQLKGKSAKRLNDTLKELFQKLQELERKKNWNEFVEQVEEVAYEYLPISSDEEELEWKNIFKQLKEVGTLYKEADLSLFLELLTEVLKATKWEKKKQEDKACVKVIELMAGRLARFPVVFIPGLIDGFFPMKLNEDPLLLDSERIILNSKFKGNSFLALKGEQFLEERFLFYLSLEQAKERLVLSCPRREMGDERDRVPSIFLMKTLEFIYGTLIPHKDLCSLKLDPQIYFWLSIDEIAKKDPEYATDQNEWELSKLREDRKRTIECLLGERGSFFRMFQVLHDRWHKDEFGRYSGYIEGEKFLNALKVRGQDISPARLMDYARCPFQYFLKYILKLNPLEEPEAIKQLDALARGNLVHKVFHSFWNELKKSGSWLKDIETTKAIEVLARHFESAKKELEEEEQVEENILWKMDLEELFELLKENLFAEGLKEASWVELVEFEYPIRGVKFELDDKSYVYFSGRIDRVELSKDRLEIRVRDYKTKERKTDSNDKKLLVSKALQLPIYLYSAVNLMGVPVDKTKKVEADFCYITNEKGVETVSLKIEKWDALIKKMQEIIRIIVDGIERGWFIPSFEGCEFCEYKKACLVSKKEFSYRLKIIKNEQNNPLNILSKLWEKGLNE